MPCSWGAVNLRRRQGREQHGECEQGARAGLGELSTGSLPSILRVITCSLEGEFHQNPAGQDQWRGVGTRLEAIHGTGN